MPWGFGRVFVNREVAERMDCIALLARLYDEFFGQFAVGESRQAQHACRVRCGQISAELICEAVKQSFRFILAEPTHFPYHLMLAGRRVEDEVWCRHFG